jgi:3-hydroxybutyryl-CoA dehydrogenase
MAQTEKTTVAVLGFGTMGAGIAQVAAQAGHQVIVLDRTEELLAAGRRRVAGFLDGGVRRGKIDEAGRDAALERITGSTEVSALAGAGLVIEAVAEEHEVKAGLLARAAEAVGEDALIATNTSALSVTALAASVPRPERFGGLHFFNPAPIMPLVEVVRAVQTSPETVVALTAFAEAAGKSPIVVEDRPGFLVNRLLMPYLNDVIQAYDDGLATAEDIDTALELGLGYPMGPLKLLDLIGLDVHEHATEAAYAATRDPMLSAPPLLRRMVEAGRLGDKTGHGFYAHPGHDAQGETTA